MEQIKNSPEIAPSDLSELMESVAAAGDLETSAGIMSMLSPKPPVKKVAPAAVTPATANSAPPVLKRPVKLADGTPLKRDKLPLAAAPTSAGPTAAAAASGEAAAGAAKRRASKRSLEDDSLNGRKVIKEIKKILYLSYRIIGTVLCKFKIKVKKSG